MWCVFFQKLRKKCLIFLIVVLIFLTACQPAQTLVAATETTTVDCETSWEQEKTDGNENLTLVLELERLEFNYDKLNKREELILSTLTLRNVGATPIWVNSRMGVNDNIVPNLGEVYFVLVSPWGESASFVPLVYAEEPEASDFKLVHPTEAIKTVSAEIMSYAFLSLREQKSKVAYPEGRYCVWAVYHNQADPGLDGPVWKGKIKSNFVEFEVKK